jgi:hypothetical protein
MLFFFFFFVKKICLLLMKHGGEMDVNSTVIRNLKREARNYRGTSVHEFNSFLEAVRHPKCS